MTGSVCTVSGCGRAHYGRGFCQTHWARWRRYGDPDVGRPIGATTAGSVSYWSVHQRLRAEQGLASARKCVGCGAAARDWSYDGTDPAQRTCPVRGYRYSLDVARYQPRCRSCHRLATLYGPGGRGLDVERAAQLYRAGASARGIGAVLHTSPATVLRALRAHGVTIRPTGRTRPPPNSRA